jgi:hypothetical protein
MKNKFKKSIVGLGIAAVLGSTVPVFEQPYIIENISKERPIEKILNEKIIEKGDSRSIELIKKSKKKLTSPNEYLELMVIYGKEVQPTKINLITKINSILKN